MIKTITSDNPEEFDRLVNDFEEKTLFPTGTTRVFATQTHVNKNEGFKDQYTAVIFYKGERVK